MKGILLLLSMWMPTIAAAAESVSHTVYIVPSRDPVLATLVSTARGLRDPVLLFDSEDHAAVRQAASEWPGARTCFYRSGMPRGSVALMESIAGQVCSPADDLAALARALWKSPQKVVVFPQHDYPAMLLASSLAATIDAALLPIENAEQTDLADLSPWQPAVVYATGTGWRPSSARVVPVADAAAAWRVMRETRPVTDEAGSVVVANPNDRIGMFSPSSLSLIAPIVSAVHRVPLLLVDQAEPEKIERDVLAFIDANELSVSSIVLVGDELGLRSHRVADPVFEAGGPAARGGGKIVRVELFSEIHKDKPQDFAVGRIVADNTVHASINLARRLHGPAPTKRRPVIFLANADKVFALGETISRATVQDLQNVGVPVRTFYREDVTAEVSQQSLAQTDVLVWEGHPRDLTLEERGGVAVDIAPDVVVLQGCYTLDRSDPFILIEKGTHAIVATSAAVYSASGSALARALFDGLVNDNLDLGTALRNARNYLLAISHLKRERGHKDWRKSWRAAMAFALWGDPLMKVPIKAGKPTQAQAQWQWAESSKSSPTGPRLELKIPKGRMRPIAVDKYRAGIAPRAMLSGILWREPGQDRRWLRELYFTAMHLPDNFVRSGSPASTASQAADAAAEPAAVNVCPPDPQWGLTTLYAPRTQTLFVLALPQWQEAEQKPGKHEARFAVITGPNGCASNADSARP